MQVVSIDKHGAAKKSLFNGKAASFPASSRRSFHNEGCLDHFPPPPKKQTGFEGREALKD